MNSPRIVVVGGVAAGMSAAARARRLSEDADIVVFERGPYVSFANCGLPYYIGGEIESEGDLLLQTPESLRARFNLDVRVLTEAIRIDPKARALVVRSVTTGQESRERYDALVLATGAAPARPPIPGIDRPGHFVLRNIPDTRLISGWLRGRPVQRAVVIGGGFVGLEIAEQLRMRDLDVSVVEALPQVLNMLDPEMAAFVHRELLSHSVDLHLGDGVDRFDAPEPGEDAAASVVVLKGGRRLPADLVVLALGVRPEIGLARDAGVEVGAAGGIRVDDRLRTSDPAIWAVGDDIEVRHRVTGEQRLIPLAGPANRQGRIVAENIIGGDARYQGTWGTGILRVFNLTAAATGADERTLRRLGIPHQAVHLHPSSHAGYYPGATPLALKLLFAEGTGKVLGAQIVGHEGVDKRIDVIATALAAGLTVRDLAELELAYAPPFGSAKDPVNLAGMAAENILDGRVIAVQWHEVSTQDQPVTLLDVRDVDEWEAGHIPEALHIPLSELRGRLGELPRDREIIVYCQSGQRSYFAARMLMQKGYACRNLSGAYRTWFAALGDIPK